MLKTLETTNLTVTVMPKDTPTPALTSCGLCGRETYITLILTDDHPRCCRRCFRARVSQARRAR